MGNEWSTAFSRMGYDHTISYFFLHYCFDRLEYVTMTNSSLTREVMITVDILILLSNRSHGKNDIYPQAIVTERLIFRNDIFHDSSHSRSKMTS